MDMTSVPVLSVLLAQNLTDRHSPATGGKLGPEENPESALKLAEADFAERERYGACPIGKEQRGWRKLIRNFTPS